MERNCDHLSNTNTIAIGTSIKTKKKLKDVNYVIVC